MQYKIQPLTIFFVLVLSPIKLFAVEIPEPPSTPLNPEELPYELPHPDEIDDIYRDYFTGQDGDQVVDFKCFPSGICREVIVTQVEGVIHWTTNLYSGPNDLWPDFQIFEKVYLDGRYRLELVWITPHNANLEISYDPQTGKWTYRFVRRIGDTRIEDEIECSHGFIACFRDFGFPREFEIKDGKPLYLVDTFLPSR